MTMTTENKVEELNNYCEGTLLITHFADWQVASYGIETFFSNRHGKDNIRAKTFSKAFRWLMPK